MFVDGMNQCVNEGSHIGGSGRRGDCLGTIQIILRTHAEACSKTAAVGGHGVALREEADWMTGGEVGGGCLGSASSW